MRALSQSRCSLHTLQLVTLVDTSGCMEMYEAMRALGYPHMPSWTQSFVEHEMQEINGRGGAEDGEQGKGGVTACTGPS